MIDYEKNKAYIVLSTRGIGKTKKMDIEFVNMSDDTGVMMTGTGLHWFCKNNNDLCQYIGMRELEKVMMIGGAKDNGKLTN